MCQGNVLGVATILVSYSTIGFLILERHDSVVWFNHPVSRGGIMADSYFDLGPGATAILVVISLFCLCGFSMLALVCAKGTACLCGICLPEASPPTDPEQDVVSPPPPPPGEPVIQWNKLKI